MRRRGGVLQLQAHVWVLCGSILVTCGVVVGQEIGNSIQASGGLTLNKINSDLNILILSASMLDAALYLRTYSGSNLVNSTLSHPFNSKC